MPVLLDRRDLRLVIGALTLMFVLVVLAYVLRPAAQQQTGSPSSYSTDWLGNKAAFSLLQQSGLRVERWQSPPSELPEQAAGVTLIFAEPSEQPSPEERAAVANFVAAGGRLVAMGAHSAWFAPQSAALEVPSNDLTPETYDRLIPSALSRNAAQVTFVAPDEWPALGPSQLSVYARQGRPGVVWYRFGKGQVIWWAVASPASNGSIAEQGNLALFLNSVDVTASRILWDEYFHGMRPSLGSFVARTPLPWAGVQLAVIFAALLITFSRRWGPVWTPLEESRLSPLEFVETLGDLYESAHAAPAAVEIAYQRLRLALNRRMALPQGAKLPQVSSAAAERYGWSSTALLHLFSDSERAMRDIHLGDREALDLVCQLHDYTSRLETQRKPSEEQPAWR